MGRGAEEADSFVVVQLIGDVISWHICPNKTTLLKFVIFSALVFCCCEA